MAAGSGSVIRRWSDGALIGWLIGALALVGLLLWAGVQGTSRFLSSEDASRPKPVWSDPRRVQVQLADGRMVSMKVAFQLSDPSLGDELERHRPALNGLIQGLAQTRRREELAADGGLQRLAGDVADAVNDYLTAHRIDGEVEQAVFEEFLVLPVSDVNAID